MTFDYTPPSHQTILGTRIDATDYDRAWHWIQTWVEQKTPAYGVAANVHVVMEGWWRRDFQVVVNRANLVTPDGMPLVWALRLLGVTGQTRVYGPDLMLVCCDRAAQCQWPIYLYGGTEAMLDRLCQRLQTQFPTLVIAGYHSPPFRSLTPEEEQADREAIQRSGAKIVFIGLGCPKQEVWMARHSPHLPAVLLGVGAAFSFHSGAVSQAPRWMMGWGLEWLYRFSQEPGRLWRRYLINNPLFVILLGWQLLGYYWKRGSALGR